VPNTVPSTPASRPVACPFYCDVFQTTTGKQAHLQPLEQPLHEALLRSFCAHLWSELCHVLNDCWEERPRKPWFFPTRSSAQATSTLLCQLLPRAALLFQSYTLFPKPPFSFPLWVRLQLRSMILSQFSHCLHSPSSEWHQLPLEEA